MPLLLFYKKNETFTSGNYKYKVTKTATSSEDGTVQLIGLSQSGLKAKNLSVAAGTVVNSGGKYTVTSIGPKVFMNAKATSITLNKNIKT